MFNHQTAFFFLFLKPFGLKFVNQEEQKELAREALTYTMLILIVVHL